jgi:Domain of unknown function (DUF4136)
MKALHRLPMSFDLNKLRMQFMKPFRALAQWNIAGAAIKYIVISLLSVATLAQLTGCASVRLIDSEVNAFSTLATVPAASNYRFERLPSQQTNPQRQDQLEAIAQASLAKVGLQRVGDAPGSPAARYSVQMGINVQRADAAVWDDWGPRFGGFVGVSSGPYLLGRGRGHGAVVGHIGFGHFGYGFPYPFPYPYVPPTYVREVSLVLRDTASNQVVFETRAKHESPWADSLNILPAMFDAALQGFPTPPAGIRQVGIELPR